MPDDIGGNETLRCEAVTTVESSGVSGIAGDLVLRAEPGDEPFAVLKSFVESLGSGSFLDDVGAFLFYMISGVRGLLVITGFFITTGGMIIWIIRRRQ